MIERKPVISLLHSLQEYVGEGWKVAILPWVEGVQGLVKETLLKEALEFLAVPSVFRLWTLDRMPNCCHIPYTGVTDDKTSLFCLPPDN